jgi:hypothetical protein
VLSHRANQRCLEVVTNPECPPRNEKTININRNTGARRAIAAAAIVHTACAVAAGALAAAPPVAAAPDSYIALSVGQAGDTPPVQTIGGRSVGPDADTARIDSLANCESAGGGHCVFQVLATNACAATAANDYGEVQAGTDASIQGAYIDALDRLQSDQGAHIVLAGCSNGYGIAPPAPTEPPKQGPTIAFNPIIGGLEARITDRSGVSAQCTYATDNLNRTFALQANSTYDLKIVPAVPQFRDWNVTIACDNGTKTQTTTHF